MSAGVMNQLRHVGETKREGQKTTHLPIYYVSISEYM